MWGVAAAFAITDRFSLIGESYGRTGLPDVQPRREPARGEGGLRVYVTQRGRGRARRRRRARSRAIGSPQARFFVSVGYAPDVRDTDGDGIANARDKCPLDPRGQGRLRGRGRLPRRRQRRRSPPRRRGQVPERRPRTSTASRTTTAAPSSTTTSDGIPDLQDKCPNDAEDGKPPYPERRLPREQARLRRRRHPRRRRRVPDRGRGHGRLRGRRRLPRGRQRRRRHPRRQRQVPAVPRGQGRLRGRRRLPGARQRSRTASPTRRTSARTSPRRSTA